MIFTSAALFPRGLGMLRLQYKVELQTKWTIPLKEV